MALTYESLVSGQQGMDREALARAAQAATLPPAPTSGNPAPLVPLGPAVGATGDPITLFNQQLMEMLNRRRGQSNAPLYNEANRLDIKQTEQSMAGAADLGVGGLAPGDALSARRNAAGLYDPEVKNLNDRIRLNNESISKFESAIESAKKYGEDYAKYVKPDDATITAVREQMKAGFLPSASVLDKVGKYLTAEDWNALSAAKDKGSDAPSSVQEYNFAKEQGYTGTYQQWLDRNRSSGSSGTPTSATERAQARQSDVLSQAEDELNRERNSSTDGRANPDTYRKYKAKYIKEGGTAVEFMQAYPVTVYISKQNQVGDLAVASGRSS